MANTSELLLPAEIEAAYFPEGLAEVGPLGKGRINTTLLAVRPNGERVVMQRLGEMFPEPTVAEDYKAVSDFLLDVSNEGLVVPRLVTAAAGELAVRDNGTYDSNGKKRKAIWRGSEFFESDTDIPSLDRPGLPMAYGVLLGRVHRALADMNYTPKFKIDNFHDTDHYAGELRKRLPLLPTEDGRDLGHKLLKVYQSIPELPETEPQLIHGDPKLANVLHRDGEPLTYIDWDGFMLGNVWMDIGDLVRSLATEAVKANKKIPVKEILEFAEGYRLIMYPEADPVEFGRACLIAGRRIAMELSMRYAADYDDQNPWFKLENPEKHANVHEQNKEFAAQRYKAAEELRKAEEAIGRAA